MSNLTCQLTQQDTGFVLKLKGQLSLADTEVFDSQIDRVFEQKPSRLVIDMSDLSDISSAGLGALLKMQLRARQNNCSVSLTALQRNIEAVIRSARLDSVFTIS